MVRSTRLVGALGLVVVASCTRDEPRADAAPSLSVVATSDAVPVASASPSSSARNEGALSAEDLATLERALVFKKGQRAPDDPQTGALIAKARVLSSNPTIKVSVLSYADDLPTHLENLDLSLARSKATVAILVKAGAREAQIWVENHGDVAEKGRGIDFHLQR